MENKFNVIIALSLLAAGIYYTISSPSFDPDFFKTVFDSLISLF